MTAMVFVGLWWVIRNLVRHNMRQCPACKGTKKIRSSMFSGRYHGCSRCGGAGEVRARFGSKS